MGLLRYCCASGMIAEARVDCFYIYDGKTMRFPSAPRVGQPKPYLRCGEQTRLSTCESLLCKLPSSVLGVWL